MNRSSYLYLGFALSSIVLAIIQWRSSEILSISVYYTIATISLWVSILELIKTLFRFFQKNSSNIKTLSQDAIEQNNKHIEILGRFDELTEEKQKHIDYRKKIVERNKLTYNNDKKERFLKKTIDIVSVLQILVVCVFVTLRLANTVPNNIANNRSICVSSLLSFAFLLISYFVKEKNDLLLRYSDELIYIEKKNEEYYLGLLEKVAPKQTDNKIK